MKQLTPEQMRTIGVKMSQRMETFTVGSRLGVIVSAANDILDGFPSCRGDLLHALIETLKADHVQEVVSFGSEEPKS